MAAVTAVPAVKVNVSNFVNPVERTVASGVQISGGNLMVLSSPNTVTKSTGTTSGFLPFGGISAFEKSILRGDTSTKLSCYMDGDWHVTVNGSNSVAVGEKVSMSGANMVQASTEAMVRSGAWIGYMKENGAASSVSVVALRGAG